MTTRFSPHGFRRKTLKIVLALLAGLLLPTAGLALAYLFIDIPGPTGSGSFGATVTVLSSGNFVVADPGYDAGIVVDVGAVYLYNGKTKQLISTLVGSQAGDQVGSGGVTALSNGNYVVSSPHWANGAVANAGAATWCSRTAGCTGTVSAANSLVGSHDGDQAGDVYGGVVTALSNGNYVVRSPLWDNGTASDAGAATWCSGTAGCTGVITITNSLVGSQAGDQVGYRWLFALSNGNYVVISWYWANGAAIQAGAATWCSGTAGCAGVVTTTNSLVGSRANDQVGSSDFAALSNGNYVVGSGYWANGAASNAGAATWCSGAAGCTGEVTTTNSLVGSQANDYVGESVGGLRNGNYVVDSPSWTNGAVANAGAVTWCSGTTGCTGVVTTTNSLVGSQAGDQVGFPGVMALSNGNYVVRSDGWDNGRRIDVGAATWCNGTVGCTGVVTTTNSLVGSHADDQVGYGGIALSNGNYVVESPRWNNGAVFDAGAATWCSGTTGCTGVVSSANSLVGSRVYDDVGSGGIALSNGNYVVVSPAWDNGAMNEAGAATWCTGTVGCTGVVSTTNSLVGSQANDWVGSGGVTALSNGNYVVNSQYWANGAVANAGAVTWCSGTVDCTAVVTATNSLVGTQANDRVGYEVTGLSDGNYVVRNPYWDNGAVSDAGAVTLGNGATGVVGPITATNSVRGTAANGGVTMVFDYGGINGRLVVGRPADNIVSIFDFFQVHLYLPLVRK